ncbi:MAG: DUF5706 domain-containing protein [Lachnospiraceae bacterium]|nr:DUF5706 domain-containing protein [Lachnospiraceae bacterium]
MAGKGNAQKQQGKKQKDDYISEQIDQMKYGFDLENMWIGNADNKVSVACALHAGIFAVITFLSEQVVSKEEINTCWENTYRITFVLSIVLLLFAIFCYIEALSPNLLSFSTKKDNGKKKYPLYFGDIADENFASYKGKICQSTPKDFLDELISETYINAGICNRKMKWYKRGLWLTFISIALSFVSMGAHYFM